MWTAQSVVGDGCLGTAGAQMTRRENGGDGAVCSRSDACPAGIILAEIRGIVSIQRDAADHYCCCAGIRDRFRLCAARSADQLWSIGQARGGESNSIRLQKDGDGIGL